MTQEHPQRRLAAVLHADVAGYSRLTGEDELGTHAAVSERLEAFAAAVARRGGQVGNFAGDAILAQFPSVIQALACAVEIQRDFAGRNRGIPQDRQIRFRVGINLGEVIVDHGEPFGDGVNVAARLEALADPGGICISGTTHDALGNSLPVEYESLGEQQVKNIAQPVRAYRVIDRPDTELPKSHVAAGSRAATPSNQRRRKTLLAALFAGLCAAGAFLYWSFLRAPEVEPARAERMAFPLPDKPALAVLPFENLSGDSQQDYFGDGLTENLITTVSQLSGVFVIAYGSARTYKGTNTAIRRVAEELGVRYVLEGSFQTSAGRVRIHAQLIDALSGHHLWAERFDRQWSDILVLQDDITENIVSALSISLTADEKKRIARRFTDSVEAYEHFLRGQSLWFRLTPEDNAEARRHFRLAIDLDPGFARAYSALAMTYAHESRFTWVDDPASALDQALQYAREAVRLDDSLPQTQFILGQVEVYRKNYAEAQQGARKALAIDANYADAFALLAVSDTYRGRAGEAIAAIERAMRINPHPPSIYHLILGRAHFFKGRYEAALTPLERAVELNPNGLLQRAYLTASYGQLGRLAEAEWQNDEILMLDPGFSVERWIAAELISDQQYRSRLDEGLRKAGVRLRTPPAEGRQPAIAVLPFENLSADPEQAYFADGIVDDLITDLSQIESLFVAARQAAFAYRGKAVDLGQAGRELGVRYILQGSIRKAGNRIRINAQLADAETGGHLWAERYDRQLADIFDLQDEVTARIVTALSLELSRQERERLAHRYTNSAEAYDAFLQGQEHYFRLTEQDNARARALYRKAIETDPAFGRAYGALAVTYGRTVIYGWSNESDEPLEQALHLARRAVALDDRLPQVHWALGFSLLASRQYDQAIAAAERALAIDPNYPDAYGLLAWIHIYAGRPERGLDFIDQALRLTPDSGGLLLSVKGEAEYWSGRLDDALATFEETVARNPNLIDSRLHLAATYARLGRQDDAEWEVQEILTLNPNLTLEDWSTRSLVQDPKGLARLLADLRQAGFR